MEKNDINILMVDDHPLIIEGYKDVLTRLKPENVNYHIDDANNCDLAWEKITKGDFDVVFLDMSFPHKPNSKFISGEDLGIQIKKEYPSLKVIVITQIEDAFQLNKLMATIHPEGFLLKRETNPQILASCVKNVIDSIPFYSPKISKILQLRTIDKFNINDNDRIILHQLSLGTKTKDLNKYVPLSFRAIENRKRKLKEFFDAEDNETLLEKARERGYI